jgi:hypothetical protein
MSESVEGRTTPHDPSVGDCADTFPFECGGNDVV